MEYLSCNRWSERANAFVRAEIEWHPKVLTRGWKKFSTSNSRGSVRPHYLRHCPKRKNVIWDASSGLIKSDFMKWWLQVASLCPPPLGALPSLRGCDSKFKVSKKIFDIFSHPTEVDTGQLGQAVTLGCRLEYFSGARPPVLS